MTLPTIDTHEFTRRGDAAEGAAPLAELDRLASMLVDAQGGLAWRLSGRSELGPDGSRTPFLRLELSAPVTPKTLRTAVGSMPSGTTWAAPGVSSTTA